MAIDTRTECAARIANNRFDPCWQAVMDLVEIDLERLRSRLETAVEADVKHLQGRIYQLRQLRKAMIGSPRDDTANRPVRSE